ncbi:MAG: ATPase, T2SS/T4P/T4SS family, partial [Perlucidibaca sp.]
APPCLRVAGRVAGSGRLPPCPDLPWSDLGALLDNPAGAALLDGQGAGQAEGALQHDQLGRARWSLARHQGGLLLVLRLLREQVPDLTEVGLTAAQASLVEHRHGLLLVTGATGSGKSCTLAALVQHWRTRIGGHVLTLEDPVEMIYPPEPGLVSQRDIGRDCGSFAQGLHAALRQAPDLILIGELRDRESARLALAAAETGHLVLATLHASRAVGAMDRLLGLFPGDERDLARG